MQKNQKSIYFITGDNEKALRNSPLLEMYKEKELEVLILDDEIDEIIMPSIPKYSDFELKSVNRSSAADDLVDDKNKDKVKDILYYEFVDIDLRGKTSINELFYIISLENVIFNVSFSMLV